MCMTRQLLREIHRRGSSIWCKTAIVVGQWNRLLIVGVGCSANETGAYKWEQTISTMQLQEHDTPFFGLVHNDHVYPMEKGDPFMEWQVWDAAIIRRKTQNMNLCKSVRRSRLIERAASDDGIRLDVGEIPIVYQSSEYWLILKYIVLWGSSATVSHCEKASPSPNRNQLIWRCPPSLFHFYSWYIIEYQGVA